MASKKTLNATNLEALGAERLAELLIEISRGNAAAQRRLRLELAGAASPGEMAQEIRELTAEVRRLKMETAAEPAAKNSRRESDKPIRTSERPH